MGVGAKENVEPEYSMNLALPDTYSDINDSTVFQPLTMDAIVAYLHSNEKTFEQKYKDLYNERYVNIQLMFRLLLLRTKDKR